MNFLKMGQRENRIEQGDAGIMKRGQRFEGKGGGAKTNFL